MRVLLAGLLALSLAACASKPPAPVEEMSSRAGAAQRKGFYRVNPGDTLYAIAFSRGLDFRELAAWNGLRSPYTIFPGQELRLTSPAGGQPGAAGSTPARSVQVTPAPPARATTRTQPAPQSSPQTSSASTTPSARPSSTESAKKPAPTPAAKPNPRAVSSPPTRWLWPANGRIIRGWSATDPSRDGIDIAGSEGDPVKASAAGTVVYSGNGLIGYGELIIVKHDERWLSAYGHNRRRLVAEGDSVKAGQHIADMGRNDRNEQVLHFEIRSNGRPVNPLDHLPSR